jgi:hypothetical protein
MWRRGTSSGYRYYATRLETARLLQDEIERLRAGSLIELRVVGEDGIATASAPDPAA